MAKIPNKPGRERDRNSAVPARPVARPAAKPAAKQPPPTPAPKTTPGKAPAAKAPASAAPPKPAVKKAAPAAAPVPKTKLSSVEKSPVSEAEIMGAVSGKLAARQRGGGMSWLGSGSRPVEPPKAEAPVVVAPVVITPAEIIEAPPAPPVPEVLEEEVLVVTESVAEVTAEALAPAESATVVELAAEPVVEPAAEPVAEPMAEPVAEPMVERLAEPVAEAPSHTFSPEAAEPEMTTPVVDPELVPPPVEVPSAPAAMVLPHRETLLLAVANEKSLSQAFKSAIHGLGWTFAVQGLIFAAFCILVNGGTPRQGLPLFLAGAVPLFAMGLIVAAAVSFQSTQRVLERLEADRLRYQQLLSIYDGPPVSLTNHRQLAHWPAWAFLGILFVAWLYIGLTVWFL